MKGIEIVDGRSWGGRRISANFNSSSSSQEGVTCCALCCPLSPNLLWKPSTNPWFSHSNPFTIDAQSTIFSPKSCEGSMIRSGSQQAVHVASWVVEEEKRTLNLSLVGFLKPCFDGVKTVVSSLRHVWGKQPIRTK